MTNNIQVDESQAAYGFGWWNFWSWLGLLIGTPVCLSSFSTLGGFSVVLAILNVALCIYMLKFSRIAFIITTVISLNPILWVAHWIYLRNRWEDPRLLENSKSIAVKGTGVLSQNEIRIEDKELVAPSPSSWSPPAQGTASESDEGLWEDAMKEAESESRRPGLWAKCYAEAGGVDAAAKAGYMAARVGEAKVAREVARRSKEAAEAQAAEESRLVRLSEEDRAYERLPKGSCPACDAVIPLSSETCPKCRAMFGSHAAWSIKPLDTTKRTLGKLAR